jgi:hypothetical protein
LREEPEIDKEARRKRVRAHQEKARQHGVKPDAVVSEDAHHNGRLVERMARRDHPHTDGGKPTTSHAAARIPPRARHVWIFVLLVTLAGALLSWWAISF